MRESSVMNETNEILDPQTDVLTEGWLHRVMLLFQMLHEWHIALFVTAGLFVTAFVSGFWWFMRYSPRLAAAVFAVTVFFMAVDAVMLINLPKKKLSFGPWKPQFGALQLPRVLLAILFAAATFPLPNRVGLMLLVAMQVFITAAFYYGLYVEPFQLQMSEILVFTDRLPMGLPPINILHITDLHIERWTHREDEVLQIVADAKPDLIVISGDYVNLSYNRDPETLRLVKKMLSRLSAPYGVYATLGSPPVDLRETVVPIFDEVDIPLMRHHWHEVDFGDGRKLVLLGMDCTHHLETDEARLAHLMSSAPNDAPQLFIYHSPELMPQAAMQGIDLYLCGHTHGGQVRLPLIGPLLTSSQLGRRFVMGHYHLGRTHLYVSRGIGLEGLSAPRVRFMAPPEMTMVMLMPGGEATEASRQTTEAIRA